MARKHYDLKTFKVNEKISINCWSEDTSYGFRHLASLYINGFIRNTSKRCYYNRTWESYQYESVLKKLCEENKSLSQEEKELFYTFIKNYEKIERERVNQEFSMIAGIMQLGSLISNNQKDSNDWKERMLKAGFENKGLIMPDNWNELSEDEKEKRLNNIIQEFK